jgi:hypothetical protein
MEQSRGQDLDPGHERVSVVTPRNERPTEVGASPQPIADADRVVGRAAAERAAAAAHASQGDLQQSVGRPLTRAGHDAEAPAWRLWLTKTFSSRQT